MPNWLTASDLMSFVISCSCIRERSERLPERRLPVAAVCLTPIGSGPPRWPSNCSGARWQSQGAITGLCRQDSYSLESAEPVAEFCHCEIGLFGLRQITEAATRRLVAVWIAQSSSSRSSLVGKADRLEKLFTAKMGSQRQFRRARLVRLYVSPALVKVVRSLKMRFAPVVRFAAPPLTSPVQTGDLALKDCAPGILAGSGVQVLIAAG
jgi:hypothetical protein